MEVLEGQKHFRRVELRLSQGELFALDVQHEITSADVLHDEVDTRLGLETRMETEQEGVSLSGSSQEYPLLRPRARKGLS